MDTKTQRIPAASSGAAKTNQLPQTAFAGEPAEIDYAPRKMTPRETLIVSLKLAIATGVVFGLLWLAHVNFDK